VDGIGMGSKGWATPAKERKKKEKEEEKIPYKDVRIHRESREARSRTEEIKISKGAASLYSAEEGR
jgi:hypothetical protein